MESKWKVSPQVEVIIVDNKRWNKIVENQIKFIDVAKEWMHMWMMENVHKIKIKLENIWIDLIMGIYAPYTLAIGSCLTLKANSVSGPMHMLPTLGLPCCVGLFSVGIWCGGCCLTSGSSPSPSLLEKALILEKGRVRWSPPWWFQT